MWRLLMNKYVGIGAILWMAWQPLACTLAQPPARKPVVVASKNFPESRLLGEIMAQVIERDTEIPVVRKLNLGYSTIVYQSLQNGQIDLYAEYTGTAWEEYLKVGRKAEDPFETYITVARQMKQKLGICWLQPFGFENSFALAMTEKRAKALGIDNISDLKAHEKTIRAGLSTDFFERSDGWQNLVKYYRLNIPHYRTMEHGLAYAALAEGSVDLIDVWTTDGKLNELNLRILKDDKAFWPPYHAAPVIRAQTLERYPELEYVLNRELAFSIDNRTMQAMNIRVEGAEDDPTPFRNVASAFLRGEFSDIAKAEKFKPPPTPSFFAFFFQRKYATLRLTLQHLLLTGVAVGLAIAVAVPIGILLTRWLPAVGITLGAAGVIQTIPSLALLAVMMPVFGLGVKAAIAALFLYALLPILRNTYTGIRGVDPVLIETAQGIGLKDWQILWYVQLPLAMRTIMAGVRTSTVISVGVATLAAFIGAGGLGEPIVTGLQLYDTNWILSGAIPAALLAIVADFLLGLTERVLAPRGT
jgi:osmoprotectant transport system permease protein